MNNVLQQYIEEFQKHYPKHQVLLATVRRKGQPTGYKVYINGDAGDMVLTEADLREAVRNFQR